MHTYFCYVVAHRQTTKKEQESHKVIGTIQLFISTCSATLLQTALFMIKYNRHLTGIYTN